LWIEIGEGTVGKGILVKGRATYNELGEPVIGER